MSTGATSSSNSARVAWSRARVAPSGRTGGAARASDSRESSSTSLKSAIDAHFHHQRPEPLERAHLRHSNGARSHRQDRGDLVAGKPGDDPQFEEFAIGVAES